MRHRVLTRALGLFVALAGLISQAAPAAAGGAPDCERTDPRTGQCLVAVVVPPRQDENAQPAADNGNGADHKDGPKDSGSGSPCYFDPSKQGFTTVKAGPVPCKSDLGYWSNAHQCYIRVLEPQPGPDDPAWQGHSPDDDGAVYGCHQPLPVDISVYMWLAAPPDASGTGPSPRQVAEMAVDKMDLHAITIGIAPEPGEGSQGVVGMPVWMWAVDPGPSTVGPATASASAGGITVTATARIHDIAWDMGDGTVVTCQGAGTPYAASYGRSESPDCGHVYSTSSVDRPGQQFTVSATSDWVVTWEGAGQTGTIRLDGLTESVQIAVGEVQVLTTD
ncbi:hypothetical protein ACFQ8T_04465 [Isoptericola sp. NPDC056618]|uniref:hypothetical protein n=1 Tax=Isoptericola sp. NPDC056618 TaxID=3345878 RepID=UPI003675E5ED